MPSLLKGKKSLYNLKVKDDRNNLYIIEMQKRNEEEDYLQRIQYHATHAITDQLEQIGHTGLNPVITISIMGRKCFDDDIEKSNLKHARDEGKQIGMTKGREEEKIEIAQNLIESGIPFDIIIKATGVLETTLRS